jgi:hypothetical protein
MLFLVNTNVDWFVREEGKELVRRGCCALGTIFCGSPRCYRRGWWWVNAITFSCLPNILIRNMRSTWLKRAVLYIYWGLSIPLPLKTFKKPNWNTCFLFYILSEIYIDVVQGVWLVQRPFLKRATCFSPLCNPNYIEEEKIQSTKFNMSITSGYCFFIWVLLT